MTTLGELKSQWMKDSEFVREYEALRDEFETAGALIDARAKANLTQKQVAERMQTSQSQVARLEGGANASLKALRKFAEATGSRLKIEFVPKES